jgi:RNA polymerase sigma-70 factor (ECF subfamily)
VSSVAPADRGQGPQLLALYDRALPQVYGYLRARVRDETLAEDLTAETFLAAVQAVHANKVPDLTIAWLVTVASNKLVDHWRRLAREERNLAGVSTEAVEDPFDEHFERMRAHEVLAALGAHHRSALTLRYLDGLSVPEVAQQLDRTVHATEALLVRARNAFRVRYAEGPSPGSMNDAD